MNFVKVLSLAVIGVAAFAVSSCGCCTGESKVPPLRTLPDFKEIPVDSPQEISVDSSK
ncbi:MAG: hypothetical protein ACON5H_11655 [Akkermansiaceae bacterium]